MCRNASEGGRRCLAHSPEHRAETRAEASIEDDWQSYLEALQERAAEVSRAGSRDEAGTILSRWHQLLRTVMRAMAATQERRGEKREKIRALRAERAAERLAEVKDVERRQRAEEAVSEVVAAAAELEAAEDARREAAGMEIRTREMEGYFTPKELAEFELQLAVMDRDIAADARDVAWAKLKRKDSAVDPATGMPTARRRAYEGAEKKHRFEVRNAARMEGLARDMPDHDTAVKNLAAAVARSEAAQQRLSAAKEAQEAALNLGRPVSIAA